MRSRLLLPGLLAILIAGAGEVRAGLFFHRDKPHPTPEPGKPRHFCDNMERAGNPQTLSHWLEPTNTNEWCGQYVGGGGGHGAGPRCRTEGTWGWDYTGRIYPRKAFLGWNHGRYPQGGTGSYRTDDPFPIPNIFTLDLLGSHD